MMNVLLLVCISLVAESWAVPQPALVPRHPSEDLIKAAAQEADQMSHSRIIGGSNSEITKHPWQVSLRYSGSHICGGVILDSTTVLTAAHCVTYEKSRYSVWYGSTSRTSYGRSVAVSEIIPHSRYNRPNEPGAYPNDIAVLKVATMTLDDKAKAIELTTVSGDELANKASCMISGWGSDGSSSLPDTLQEADVAIIADEQCKNTWGSNIHGPYHVCIFGNENSSACNGDSGGPLVCQNNGMWELVGVTSWGATGCPVSYPSVYTEVNTYSDLIKANMG